MHFIKRTREKDTAYTNYEKTQYKQLCTHANLQKNEGVQLICFLKKS